MFKFDKTKHSVTDVFRSLHKLKSECSHDSRLTAERLINLRCSLPLAVILRDPLVIEHMLDSGCDVNERDDQLQVTALYEAIGFSNLPIVKLLVDRGADVNSDDVFGDGSWLFKFKLSEKRAEILRFLLERGGRPTLGIVIDVLLYGSEAMIKMLVRSVDFRTKSQFGCNALHAIASNENFDPVELLRGRRLDVDAQDFYGSTALIIAARDGNAKMVEFLLAKGARVDLEDFEGSTVLVKPFSHSTSKRLDNRLRIIELLLEYGADPLHENGGRIFDVVLRHRRFKLIKPYLAHLALVEDLGVCVGDVVHDMIGNSHVMFKKYFELCKRRIEKMKRTVVFQSVTLYKFLTVDERKSIKFVQNRELLLRLRTMMYHKRRSKMYYDSVLRRRVNKAERMVNLREIAFDLVSQIRQLGNNLIVIEKIIDYFSTDDLESFRSTTRPQN